MTLGHVWLQRLFLWTVCLLCSITSSQGQVSTNLALDDPDYALLDKLVQSNVTFANALTIKPMTRIRAARLIAEAIEQRRTELETAQRQAPFLDEILEHLAGRFKRELQQIGFLYKPRRFRPFFAAPMVEFKLDMVGSYNQFVPRDGSGLTPNVQGVFRLHEGFAYGDDFTLRLRTVSWATLWDHYAAYVEPAFLVRSDPIRGDTFESKLYKGYLKASYGNLEVEVGRDSLWWGPAAQGDLLLSNNAPPFELVKFSTPVPFRLPGIFQELGEWQMAYFAARLEEDRHIPHALVSGLRLTLQPASYLTFGFSNAFQAFGKGGVQLDADDYLRHIFVPELDTAPGDINGLVAYDVVLTLPFVRDTTPLQSVQFYWQRGHDSTGKATGLLGGSNILGAVVDGGRWDLRFEFAETRDASTVWYTHPTYRSGYSFQQFFIGHPMGGDAQSFFTRARYYFTPTWWIAADGLYEQYGFTTQPAEPTQRRLGLEASYQLPWQRRHLVFWGRVEYANLETPAADSQHAVTVQLSTRWRF